MDLGDRGVEGIDQRAGKGWVPPDLAATGRGLCFVSRYWGLPRFYWGTDITKIYIESCWKRA